MTPSPKIAVLILGYNHKKYLSGVFNSVSTQTYSNFDIFYIDNASSDKSVEFTKKKYPNVHLITNETNLGYAGAYDIALRNIFQKNYDAAVLLNPDTRVDKEWLFELVNSGYADKNIALAQSKVFIWNNGPTKTINTFGNNIHFLGFGYCGHYQEQDGENFFADRDASYASGSSLLIKKEYYPSVIRFDTDYFAYLEDQDLGWQAHLQNLRVIVSARSKVWHTYDFQKKHLNNFKFYLLERNRLTFLIKYYEWKTLFLIAPIFCVMECGMIFDALMRGYFEAKMKSYWHFFKQIPRSLQSRRIIQSVRKKSDHELFALLSPTIEFEAVDSPLLRLANFVLFLYHLFIRRLI